MIKVVKQILCFLFLATSACSKEKEEAKDNLPKVCCESFGYGSQMKKCCESYEMVTVDKCKVPKGFVGGGMQQVDLSFCKKSKS